VATHEGLHEDGTLLPDDVVDRHRALASLGEELEAIDWYDQRIAATKNAELKEVLAHNRDEEKEHAAMVLEWLRRRDAQLDAALRTYLFAEGSIVGREAAAEAGGGNAEPPSDGSLGIGTLKEGGPRATGSGGEGRG
jgi:ferritin-like protein